MIGIFRQKNPGNNLLLLGYALILKFGILLKSSLPLRQEEDHYLYILLLRFLTWLELPKLVFGLIAFLLLYVQGVILNKVCIDHKMLAKPNYLPGMAYVLLSSLFVEWNHFSAPLLVNTLLILMFNRMVHFYNSNRPLSDIYNTGLLLGIATLLYQPALVFALLMVLALFIMRPFRVREWLTGFLGITTPYYFLALEPLFTNRWTWKHLLPAVHIDLPAIPSSVFTTASIALLVLPFILGGYYVQLNMNKMLIQVRKAWSLLLLLLILSMCIILVNGGVNYVNWMFGLMPLSAFHAASYYYPEKRIMPLVLHWVTFCYAMYIVYWTY